MIMSSENTGMLLTTLGEMQTRSVQEQNATRLKDSIMPSQRRDFYSILSETFCKPLCKIVPKMHKSPDLFCASVAELLLRGHEVAGNDFAAVK